MNYRLWAAALVALIAVAALGASLGASGATAQVRAPKGWRQVHYGAAAIFFPKNWYVGHDDSCMPTGPGDIEVGWAAKTSCLNAGSQNRVTIAPLTTRRTLRAIENDQPAPGEKAPYKKRTVNGFVVYYVRYKYDTTRTWFVPQLGAQLTGVGPKSLAVLETLHPWRSGAR
jgi:hypothetical protein